MDNETGRVVRFTPGTGNGAKKQPQGLTPRGAAIEECIRYIRRMLPIYAIDATTIDQIVNDLDLLKDIPAEVSPYQAP